MGNFPMESTRDWRGTSGRQDLALVADDYWRQRFQRYGVDTVDKFIIKVQISLRCCLIVIFLC